VRIWKSRMIRNDKVHFYENRRDDADIAINSGGSEPPGS